MRIPSIVLFMVLTASAGAQQPCSPRAESIKLAVQAQPAYLLTARLGGGHPQRLQVDTGSTGIAIWEAYIGTWTPATDVTLPPFIEYNSTGRRMVGRWVYTSVELTDAAGTVVTIPKLAVLAVHRICVGDDCGQLNWPKQLGELQALGMLGVGFDRGYSMGTPAENAFLNLPQMLAGTMQQGYVLTRAGIILGMTAADVAGFDFIPLTGTAPDWTQARGCVSVAGSAPVCGRVLMDTGVDHMFLTYRQNPPAPPGLLPAGTRVTVTWPDATAPAFTYPAQVPASFSPSSPNPRYAQVGVNPSLPEPVFVNTSRQLLNFADYLYDATCGRVGFRR